jgi:hypothetical protein
VVIETANLKVDKPTYALILAVSNAAIGAVDALTPSNPVDLTIKALVTVAWNALIVWIGVESGDLPAPT